jgi:hypothetical protein
LRRSTLNELAIDHVIHALGKPFGMVVPGDQYRNRSAVTGALSSVRV